MNKEELDNIFDRVEDELMPLELARVAEFIDTSSDPILQHRGLHILGWAHATEYTPLIASFLSRRDELMLPEMAIRALVFWFHDARPYLDILKAFLAGIPEDAGRDLQLVALQIAGEAYRQTSDPEILRSILPFLQDEDSAFRFSVQDALVNALTPQWEDLLPNQRHELRLSFSAPEYMEKARRALDDG